MPAEKSLSKSLLRSQFRSKVESVARAQEFIPFHMKMLSSRDPRTKDGFRHIQRWYTQILNLSIETVRDYMRLVDLHELQDFSVQPITRKTKRKEKKVQQNEAMSDVDDDKDTVMPDADDIYDTVMSDVDDLNNNGDNSDELGPSTADENNHTDLELQPNSEFDTSMAENTPQFAPQNTAFLSDTLMTQYAQQDPLATLYNDYGFHNQSGISWADEMNEDADVKKNTLSDGLLKILKEMGVKTTPTRTEDPVVLTPEELAELEWDWINNVVRDYEARPKHYFEKRCSLDMDEWDSKNSQYCWQTEGMFLCRLTELIFQGWFQPAKSVFHMHVKRAPRYKRREHRLPTSPLANELIM
ncbi:hypothetical protein F4859DRAFT_527723 [Xylaria cf. heliscus]|nr:hypothetical protein F4859DRAFT_527723 [Xylaria cf. heliscus]